jgi:hypothetical protein
MGNDRIQPFQYLTAFQAGGNYIFNEDVDTQSIRRGVNANRGVSWEVARNSNIGVEGVLFNGKLNFEFDVFRNLRTEILWAANNAYPLTPLVLFLRIKTSLNYKIRGFDFLVGYNTTIGQEATFSVSLNGGYAINEILFWDEPPGKSALAGFNRKAYRQ